MVLQAGPQGDGNESLPMNNTLMTFLPITVKPTLCAKGNVEGEGGFWGKRRQRDGGGKCEGGKMPAGSL